MFAFAKKQVICPPPPAMRVDEFLAAFTGKTTLQLDAENVKYQNSLQVISAERFIFSIDNEFDMIREMLTTHPNLKTGPRVAMAGRHNLSQVSNKKHTS
jgi:hypothetical protein